MADYNPLWGDYVLPSDKVQTTTKTTETTKIKKGNDELDKDAFLMLLVTQMKYQDPLNPVDDKEFIAQMAQFSSLEQMTNLNKTVTNSQTFGLVGKYVHAELYNDQTGEYTKVMGKVDAVTMKNKIPYLVIGKYDVPMEDVVDVFEDEMTAAINESAAMNDFTAQNVAMIGKFIQAMQFDKDGNPTAFIEGRVDEVKLIDGVPYMIVDGKQVKMNERLSVSDKMQLIGRPISYIDNEGVVKPGVIDKVEVGKDILNLVVSGVPVSITNIEQITNALKKLDTNVTIGTHSGLVSNVVIRNSVPYFVINGEEVLASGLK